MNSNRRSTRSRESSPGQETVRCAVTNLDLEDEHRIEVVYKDEKTFIGQNTFLAGFIGVPVRNAQRQLTEAMQKIPGLMPRNRRGHTRFKLDLTIFVDKSLATHVTSLARLTNNHPIIRKCIDEYAKMEQPKRLQAIVRKQQSA